ncbi:hypothetical protein SAMN05216368_11292 [Cryobacterium flavum]|uniref:Thioredoxin reductase (NADPH) n=1 Tax=Cryobacterium flavum TaxID=1424659 RepID=A0A4R8UWS5_9MICO|nr:MULTISPECIES: hypothetical protein [Cryobacterium]TFB71972.1 hypothetical protein E3O21_19230 [Cryobacterium flavum]SDO21571.1 hypothetical protein SAMN05216368_11292 [Cryobacterium flavum]
MTDTLQADVVVVGGGPAGLAAAIYGIRIVSGVATGVSGVSAFLRCFRPHGRPSLVSLMER